MKIDFIPFQIGMQYENWEFDLDAGEDLVICERYRYIKDDILEILGVPISDIYLYFNADILVRVDLKFQKGTQPKTFIELAVTLESKYGRQLLFSDNEKSTLYKKWNDVNKCILLKHFLDDNSISILVTKHRYANLY